MKKGQAFFVVGHAHWGKSETLFRLTGNRRRTHWIKGILVAIIRRSNDDDPRSLYHNAQNANPNKSKHLLIAFCPNFASTSAKTVPILTLLRRKYKLYFFVLKKCYTHDDQVSPAELKELLRYGEVEILEQRIKHTRRAKKLLRFVERNIKP